MRIAIFILLFANVLIFAYIQSSGTTAASGGTGDLNPEKIRLLSAEQVAKLPVLP